jgi:hypothetical protein
MVIKYSKEILYFLYLAADPFTSPCVPREEEKALETHIGRRKRKHR